MKRSRNKKTKAAAVELTEQELGDVAGGGDGAIYNTSSNLTLSSSTLSGNRSASGDGFDDIIVGTSVGSSHVK